MPTLTITVAPAGAGWTDPAAGSYVYEQGASVRIEAYPNTGYEFDHWDITFVQSGVAVPVDSWFELVPMTEDIQATAHFNIVTRLLTVLANPAEGGTVTPESGEYQVGSLVLLTAYPNSGWKFSHWQINGQIKSWNPIQVLIQVDTQITAWFSLGAEFEPGSSHTARVMMSNPTSKAFNYEGYLYMGTGLAVVSQALFNLGAGESKEASFPVIMPAIPGVYPVHLGVFSGGVNIALYKAVEDVTIVAPAITDPNIKSISINYWTQDSIPSDFLVNSRQSASLMFASYISATYKLEVVLVKNGEVKASAYFEGYFQDSNVTYTSLDVDNIVMPSEPGEYEVQIRTYRGGQLTGVYPEGKLSVYPIAEPSYLDYRNLIYQILNYPGLTLYYLDVECDIVNTGSKTITREVALWLHKWSLSGGPRFYERRWRVIVRDSHEPGGINAGRVAFTLAPSKTFHYHFAGQTIGHGEICVELRDNMGGKSDYRCITW